MIKMDYKYDNSGIELLMVHMNLEDIINAVENLYNAEEEDTEESFDEGMSQEEMYEHEETMDSGSSCQGNGGGVRYGTVTDLLSFVNLISDTQLDALQHLPDEMGVLLNKVRLWRIYSCQIVYQIALCRLHESESERGLFAIKVCTDKEFTLPGRCIH